MDLPAPLPPLAATLGVSFDGRAFHYRRYSYDRLDDALDYARRDRARPDFQEEEDLQRWPEWPAPTGEEQARMAAHQIVFRDGHYWYGPYRYDLLASALDYARREPGLPATRHAPSAGGRS